MPDRPTQGDERPEFYRYGVVMPISRETALDLGVVQPTPEELAEAERRAAEFAHVKAVHDERMAAFRAELAAIADPVARVVLDLHVEGDRHECCGCDYDCEPLDWPCRTVVAVAGAVNVPVPQGGDVPSGIEGADDA